MPTPLASPEALSITWDSLTRDDWQAHLARCPSASLQQHWAYGDVMQAYGATVRRGLLHTHNTSLGLMQLTERRRWKLSFTTLQRGPAWLTSPTASQLLTLATTLRTLYRPTRGDFLLWMPEACHSPEAHTAGYRRVITPYHTAMLNLTPSLETLRATLSGTWRTTLRQAEKNNLTLRTVPLQDSDWLLTREALQRRQRHYRGLPTVWLQRFMQAAADDSFCFMAYDRGEPVAGMLFLRHGPNATYALSYSTDKGKTLRAHYHLFWHAIQHLKSHGVTAIDMGSLNTQDTPGIARFKLGTGATPLALSGSYL